MTLHRIMWACMHIYWAPLKFDHFYIFLQTIIHLVIKKILNYLKMEGVGRKRGGGVMEGFYKLVMRRNSVYVTFVIAGAFLGERAVDYGVKKIWENNNVGKRYEDIPTLGQRPSE
ncbi:reductase [Lithospermum erythrorhizon]|uniref:Complex III subunit 9 n=1 Tax=Lithospermum erythrorhizon TaxID=34254 RepID=A0AAV3P6J2_LITER